ncbi:MAG: Cys-tRNA(Pro) deacylase [Cyanobacteria bacterium P01_A01_bin.135]
MTPAVKVAERAKVEFRIHEYDHDPTADSYGEEAAEKLGIAPQCVFKTLVVSQGADLAVAVLPVSQQLNLKQFAKAIGAKKVAMADKAVVQRVTGYVLGGVSPLGQKKALTTVIDASAKEFNTIYVSAGRRGLEIELSPQDLGRLTRGTFAVIGA